VVAFIMAIGGITDPTFLSSSAIQSTRRLVTTITTTARTIITHPTLMDTGTALDLCTLVVIAIAYPTAFTDTDTW
jgi:hypothetical protein